MNGCLNSVLSARITAIMLLCWAVMAIGRELPPAGGTPRNFQLPPAATIELDNGLRATFVEFGEAPKVNVSAVVEVGAVHAPLRSLAPQFAGGLLSEGTRKRSASELARAAADMGGALATGTGDDQTSVDIDVLSDYGPAAVAMMAEVLREPAFLESEFTRVQQNLLRTLAVARTRPQSQANEAFNGLIYPNHPYGDPLPTDAEVLGTELNEIKKFHAAQYGARRTHIYVAGRFDRAAVEAAVRTAFADWEPGPEPVAKPAEPVAGLRVKLIDRPGAPQSTLLLGIPVADPSQPDWIPLSLTNMLLGGYFSSRITANIREDKGYTYSPGSAVSARYRTATWVLSADVTTADTGAALREIFAEIRKLQAEPPAAGELEQVKRYAGGTFVLGLSTRGALGDRLAWLNFHGLPRAYLDSFVQRVYAVTPDQVSTLARRYLPVERMTLVVVGDLAKVRPQLEALPELKEAEFK